MSCSWDVYCLDCKSHLGMDVNRGDKEMRKLIRFASELATLAPINEEGNYELEARYCGWNVKLDWFAQHKDHWLKPINEYGQFDDGCDEYFTCGECETRHSCKRIKGHDGKHSPKRDEKETP